MCEKLFGFSASEILLLGTAVITFITTLAASSCCAYVRKRNDKYTIDTLKERRRTLRGLINDLKRKKGKAIVTRKQSCTIQEADDVVKRASGSITELERGVEDKCLCGLLPNYCTQMQTWTTIKDLVLELNAEMEIVENMLQEPVKGYKQSHEVKIVGNKRIEEAEKIWKEVSGLKQSPQTICIHGAFGVGKTAIAKYIHNRALEDDGLDVFDCVMWVNVEYGAGIRQVQDDIASILEIDLSPPQQGNPTADTMQRTIEASVVVMNENRRRALLLEQTLREKKFLLVLDSVWQPFSLAEIGIPELGEQRKLIVTSRISTVCDNMVSYFKSEIRPLSSSEEAWELFTYTMGSSHPQRLAEENVSSSIKRVLLAEMDGFPLAIVMLAMRLWSVQEDVWNVELDDLTENLIQLHLNDQGPLDRFKRSYQNLEPDTRSCFLFCALFPNNHLIQSTKLIEYWMCEGLLGNNVQTLKPSMQRGNEILNELTNAHLLQPQRGGDKVKMLNLVRSMAIRTMGTEGRQVFIQSGRNLTTLRGWDSDVERASVMENQLRSLNRPLLCMQLSTLLLQDNPLDRGLDDRFFDGMPTLRVLDMSRTLIKSLPSSLSGLINLHVLILHDCPHLTKLPNLGNLRQLLVLNVSGTPIEECPQGLQRMIRLRRLILSQTRLETFPATAICTQLRELEELLMTMGYDGGFLWASNELDVRWSGPCIEDLLRLEHLDVLHLNFLNKQVFDMYIEKAVQENKLPPKFRFCVGGFQSTGRHVGDNSVTIIGDHRVMLPNTTLELHLLRCDQRITTLELEKHSLSNLQVLYVSDLSGINYLFSVDVCQSLNKMTELHVRKCKQMLEVIKPLEEGDPPIIVLPKLKKLALFDLPKLKRLCYGIKLICPALCSPDVSRCENLKYPYGLETAEIHSESSNSYFRGPTPQAETTFANAVASSSCCLNMWSREAGRNLMEKLKERQCALKDLIEDAKKKIEKAVVIEELTNFITEAGNYLIEVSQSIVDAEKGIQEKCMSGMLPNICARNQARTCMEMISLDLERLIEKGKLLVQKYVRGYKQPGQVNIIGKRRRDIVEDICKQLLQVALTQEADEQQQPDVAICIHGALGVGKTAIAKFIHNKALVDLGERFDHVIWVNVEYGAGLWQVQDEIASKLELDWHHKQRNGDTVKGRARRLRSALVDRGKFLLVVDSISQPFCLDDIGIPTLVGGRKLIVTSRVQSVFSEIEIKQMFEVHPLPSVEEAWEMFENEIGSTFLARYQEFYGNFRSHIEGVLLAQLDGLPLAIFELADTLASDDIQKTYLCSSRSRTQQPWHLELRPTDLFHRFANLCDHLEEVTRNCFLHMSLLSKNQVMNSKELIEYWMWEGLLGDMNDIETLEEGMEKGRQTLDDLLNAHLLECVGYMGDQHKLHMLNVFRAAIETMLTNAENKLFVKSAASLTHLPLQHEWPLHVEKASFTHNQINVLRLTQEAKFNTLSTLLLQDNPLQGNCDRYFFYSMPALRSLDMSRTNISYLPNSLSSLKSLQILIFRNCAKLKILPDLSNLRDLMIFDFSGTSLEVWPQGIQNMKKLRRLNLSRTKLAKSPANVFGQLMELEELLMLTGPGCMWGSRELDQWEGACIEELLGLKKLILVEVQFAQIRAFHMYANMANKKNYNLPPSFRFCVGKLQSSEPVGQNSVIINGRPSTMLSTGTLELCSKELKLEGCLKNLILLDVSDCTGLEFLFPVALDSLSNLRELCVRRCENMTKVMKPVVEYPSRIQLPKLTTMVFLDLPNLESVSCGRVLDCPSLCSIHVSRCDKLKLPMIIDVYRRAIEIRCQRSWFDSLSWDNPENEDLLFQGSPRHLRFFKMIVAPETEASINSNASLPLQQGWAEWLGSWMSFNVN